jgi:hypothetical protein
MKKIVLALAALTALSTASAYAYNCTTNCQQIGNQWICNQSCSEW